MLWIAIAMSALALILSLAAVAVAPASLPRSCATHGHNYEARYHIEPTLTKVDGRRSAEYIASVAEATANKTYVHDICKYCGDKKLELPKAKS
jgi:hypothetical protein